MLSLVCFLGVLSVLVLVHEFGHFIAAKRIGVRVEKFSFGFGPRLCSVRRGDTEYILSAIPLGGYVKMSGDEPTDERALEKWEFLSRKISERFNIIFAGPLLNYLLAFLIFSVIFMFGPPTLTTEIGGLLRGSPAEAGRLAAGDTITAVDGKPVKYWEEMTALIHEHVDGPVRLSVRRGDETFDREIIPKVRQTKDIFGKEVKAALIGISPSQRIEKVKYGFLQSFAMAFRKLIQLTVVTYKSVMDSFKERVRYFLSGTDFKKGVTKPNGLPLIYNLASENIVTLATNVRNADTFSYYDQDYGGSSSFMSFPLDVTAIRVVRLKLSIDDDPTRAPMAFEVQTVAEIRNLKGN